MDHSVQLQTDADGQSMHICCYSVIAVVLYVFCAIHTVVWGSGGGGGGGWGGADRIRIGIGFTAAEGITSALVSPECIAKHFHKFM